ncbi:hypothetical protein ACFVMC_32830 [Nocardia sp. NPDC127579]|uniref:hypothetical protein n=1 Tax=Nocardia sp. NPDC127579 TaxID=3345402 RepID=UPI0036306810
MTETVLVDLYMIARLGQDCAVADIFCCEVFADTTTRVTRRGVAGWWESVATTPELPVTLDALDTVLASGGYTRLTGWRPKVTAAGAVRYFADATTNIENIDYQP